MKSQAATFISLFFLINWFNSRFSLMPLLLDYILFVIS